MRVVGIGPTTSVLSGQRSTTELHTQTQKQYNRKVLKKQTKNPPKRIFCFSKSK